MPNTGDEFDIAREQITSQGATVKVEQRAFYIQDSWNITDNFIAYLGGRWDTFENSTATGETYVKIDDQFGPRLGFSWDVNGDSTFKVFGNAGRYALPLTPSVAVRGASASLFTPPDSSTSPVWIPSPARRRSDPASRQQVPLHQRRRRHPEEPADDRVEEPGSACTRTSTSSASRWR